MQNTRIQMVGGVHGQVALKLDDVQPARSAFPLGKPSPTIAIVHCYASAHSQ